MDYQTFIENILDQSSEIALEHFGSVKGWAKDGDKQTVLTDADLAIGRYIINAISKEYSQHNVIDEEAGVIDRQSEFTWVVDPIDGTSNFAAGSPLYGIMIGLLENDMPVAGGFALPSLGEIYVAVKGRGANLNGKPIHVSKSTHLGEVLLAFGLHAKTKEDADYVGRVAATLIPNILNIRSSASTFDMGMVAKGVYGGFISTRGKIWDCVGPQIVIEEAGGVFTHFDGKPIDYSNATSKTGQQYSYFMASPSVHSQVSEIIKAVL
jgi:myo-inositol-1(or 4)-monophosphatase